MHAIPPPRFPLVYTATRCLVQTAVYGTAAALVGAIVYAIGAAGGAW